MVTHDTSGPLLLTVARARPFIAYYLTDEGYRGHEFTVYEGIGTVTVAVAGVPEETMARIAARLRDHVCVGVKLEVIAG